MSLTSTHLRRTMSLKAHLEWEGGGVEGKCCQCTNEERRGNRTYLRRLCKTAQRLHR